MGPAPLGQPVDVDELVPEHAGRWLLVAVGCLTFVVAAIAVEVLASRYAGAAVPGWAGLVPLAWPQPARVGWWLVVATAAGGFRYGIHRLGFPQRRLVVVLTVGPFLWFAFGVASGADWSTWH